jgi:pimeloyl-ACP methyl ester carboxylesterase
VGHLPNLERPEAFNRAVLDYLLAQNAKRSASPRP